jgi:hypothetical protein
LSTSLPKFIGCSSDGSVFSDFDNRVNSVLLNDLFQEDSIFRCLDLEQKIKNQSVDGSKQACSYDLSKIRDTLFVPAKTFFIRLVTCPQSSSLSASPFAGCFPVKRSVRQLLTESLAIVLIPIIGGIDFFARDDEHSHHYSPS